MRPYLEWWLGARLFASLVALSLPSGAFGQAIWLTPGPGSVDFLELVTREWLVRIAETVTVIQFYDGHLLHHPNPSSGPNTLPAFAAQGTFYHLQRAGIATAMEAGVVKHHSCNDFGSREAIRRSQEAIRNVRSEDGDLQYLSMDEPFVGGIHHCYIPDFQVAERTADYMKAMRATSPGLKIGLTEAYPTFTVRELVRFTRLLGERTQKPDFFHLDLHLSEALKTGSEAEVAREVRMLADSLEGSGIAFGLIIWGESGLSDFHYAEDAMRLVRLTKQAFGEWRDMPRHIPLQSWTANPHGLRVIPKNLPPTEPATHLDLVNRMRDCLRENRGCNDPIR